MRRTLTVLATTLLTLALLAPAALADNSGEGLVKADDKTVTNAGFIVIAAIPLFILCMSLLQWRLDKRKDARKKATKARAASQIWHGGW